MELIRRWWRQPDHYQWLSSYLAARNLQTFTRVMMFAVVGALGLVPVLMLLTPAGPHGPVARALSIAVTACCAVMALLWLATWPTRNQSAAFVVVANLCIAIACLVGVWPGMGIEGCTLFVALAAYVAFFHTSPHQLFTLCVSLATTVACAVEITIAGDAPLAASKMLILVVSIIAVPMCVQVLVQTLGIDALKSDVDPLTDLPNRRAFQRSVRALAKQSSRDGTAHLSVVMVDLDDFKRINDTAGHAAGDQTLIAVGQILHRSRRADSVIARIGGEEFVVALSGDRRDAVGLAERLRLAIRQTPSHPTASVGVASASLVTVTAREIPAMVDRLVESADRAMYRAKRAGGDAVEVFGEIGAGHANAPTASRTTATNGSAPWITAERALPGADARSTIAAASMGPTPANSSATPTRVPPEIMNAMPTAATKARNRL